VPAEATAFVHRDERFLLKHTVVVTPARAQPTGGRAGLVVPVVGAGPPVGLGGVYPNFPDPDLEDWPHAYYGSNYERLVRVKKHYDPDGFFRSAQSLP
jgi:hypothetical protein